MELPIKAALMTASVAIVMGCATPYLTHRFTVWREREAKSTEPYKHDYREVQHRLFRSLKKSFDMHEVDVIYECFELPKQLQKSLNEAEAEKVKFRERSRKYIALTLIFCATSIVLLSIVVVNGMREATGYTASSPKTAAPKTDPQRSGGPVAKRVQGTPGDLETLRRTMGAVCRGAPGTSAQSKAPAWDCNPAGSSTIDGAGALTVRLIAFKELAQREDRDPRNLEKKIIDQVCVDRSHPGGKWTNGNLHGEWVQSFQGQDSKRVGLVWLQNDIDYGVVVVSGLLNGPLLNGSLEPARKVFEERGFVLVEDTTVAPTTPPPSYC